MEKDAILQAIRRCAEDNGGVAVGRSRFEALTGIREHEWSGRYWTRWSDAVAEAGFTAGRMNPALPDDEVLRRLAVLISELKRYPTRAELKMRRAGDAAFPSPGVFERLGSKADVAAQLIKFCGQDPHWAEVAELARPVAVSASPDPLEVGNDQPLAGEVYLMQSGAHFKVGRSNSTGRRAYELAIQLPERIAIVHVIETDDAVGIEHYWHRRFASRRLNGEWFALTKADVTAFKRRKRFM